MRNVLLPFMKQQGEDLAIVKFLWSSEREKSLALFMIDFWFSPKR